LVSQANKLAVGRQISGSYVQQQTPQQIKIADQTGKLGSRNSNSPNPLQAALQGKMPAHPRIQVQSIQPAAQSSPLLSNQVLHQQYIRQQQIVQQMQQPSQSLPQQYPSFQQYPIQQSQPQTAIPSQQPIAITQAQPTKLIHKQQVFQPSGQS